MAGFLGFGDYEKTGAGIAKNAPKKKNTVLFFERYFSKIWKLMGLNVLYILFCLPVVTIGPATAGLTKVLRNFSQEKPTFIMHDFWESFKSNFKQSLIVGIADIIIVVNIVLAISMYPQMAAQNSIWWVILGLTFSIAGMAFVMNFYAFLMIVSTELSLKNILKNSFFLSCIALKKNAITVFISLLLVASLFFMPDAILFLIIPFFPLTTIGFLACFNCYPIIRKYVIDPYYESRGEKNPEDAKWESNGETLFEDRGGFEKPAEGKSRKKKGKTIS